MLNDKWVKTFIGTDNQVNVTCIPTEDKFIVAARTMVGGKMFEKMLYDGDRLERASDALDNFNRHESEIFSKEVFDGRVEGGGSIAEVPVKNFDDEEGFEVEEEIEEDMSMQSPQSHAVDGFSLDQFEADRMITEVGKGGVYWWDGKTLVVVDGDGKDLATKMKDCMFLTILAEDQTSDSDLEDEGVKDGSGAN